ncbi:hypothetical protein E2562_006328 [Oryza meyeriana var. granulata]|uniref:Uncharacterized protein n=1 Tax=Oryza meyeriana var. granulata TaxID=110450 RepID=A0A6G1EF94_9ORYZ|nr:hypothetical protein E2562_006328 [Oryza meyeriana var. granulata]
MAEQLGAVLKRLGEMEEQIREDTKQEIQGVRAAIESWKPEIELRFDDLQVAVGHLRKQVEGMPP